MRSALTFLFGAVLWSLPVWCQSNAGPSTDMIPRTIKAIGYPVGGGSTMVDLKSVGTLPGIRPGQSRSQGCHDRWRLRRRE